MCCGECIYVVEKGGGGSRRVEEGGVGQRSGTEGRDGKVSLS